MEVVDRDPETGPGRPDPESKLNVAFGRGLTTLPVGKLQHVGGQAKDEGGARPPAHEETTAVDGGRK
jgi:hypothetical protein